MSCPYTDEQLQYWDGVTNPMGNICYKCEEFECEHNPNSDNADLYWPDVWEVNHD